jgi:hypothetical protein
VEEGDALAVNVRFWPLFTYRREGDGSRLRIPELWPLPPTAGVEQNWAPLWSVYRRSRWFGSEEDEFLWGLCRHRSDRSGWRMSVYPLFAAGAGDGGRSSEWSILEGLVGYRRSDLGRVLKFLYVISIGL